MVKIPDILNLEPRLTVDETAISALLELAFMGKEAAKGLDRQLGIFDVIGHGWQLDLFAEDLFVRDLIEQTFTISRGGVRFPVNQAFLFHVLSDPPTDIESIQFRQNILKELDGSKELEDTTQRLYQELTQLLAMFKAPDHAAKLDVASYRLDIFRQAKWIIDWMVDEFGDCDSGLRRLSKVGQQIQDSEEYALLADLLEYNERLATVDVRLAVGGDGEVKHLEILDHQENTQNRFYRSPLGRLVRRGMLFFVNGYKLGNREIVNRLLQEVYHRVAPSLIPLVQLTGQLEFYLAGLSFRRQVESQGLHACLPTFDDARGLELHDVFNPLLLAEGETPVPCSVSSLSRPSIAIITGPNSGGKTRLLQSLGLSQLLGQSGLYVPAADANLCMIRGLFVSLVENETVHQAEGRLGRELMRIRTLFETMGSPSMVILDELCSGTNPTEGTEIFSMVLRLLDRLDTTAFISTHFLDYAQDLQRQPPVANLDFLHVESDEHLKSTYQFLPGVAKTSLAEATAERLGVSFDKLASLIEANGGRPVTG